MKINLVGRCYSFFTLAVLLFSLNIAVAHAYGGEIYSSSKSLVEKISKHGGKSIAVVDFVNLDGDVTELGRFIAEEFTVNLSQQANSFKVIDRANLQSVIKEHRLYASGMMDPQTVKRLGNIAGVEYIMTGTIVPMQDIATITVKVLDVNTAQVIGAERVMIPLTQTLRALLNKKIQSDSKTR